VAWHDRALHPTIAHFHTLYRIAGCETKHKDRIGTEPTTPELLRAVVARAERLETESVVAERVQALLSDDPSTPDDV